MDRACSVAVLEAAHVEGEVPVRTQLPGDLAVEHSRNVHDDLSSAMAACHCCGVKIQSRLSRAVNDVCSSVLLCGVLLCGVLLCGVCVAGCTPQLGDLVAHDSNASAADPVEPAPRPKDTDGLPAEDAATAPDAAPQLGANAGHFDVATPALGDASHGSDDAGLSDANAAITGDATPDREVQPDAEEAPQPDGASLADQALDAALSPNDSQAAPSDAAPADAAPYTPAVLGSGLLHRYSFAGTGTVASDSVGELDGSVVNTVLTGTGQLTLAGGDTQQFVELPVATVDGLTQVTLEAWVTWTGPANSWQRVIDLGTGVTAVPGGRGVDFLYLTPDAAGPGGATLGVYLDGISVDQGVSSQPFTRNAPTHVVVVFDSIDHQLVMYVNGQAQSRTTLRSSLVQIAPQTFWLGRSRYSSEGTFAGTFDEFRIYSEALTAQQVATSYRFGPDAL